MVINDDSEAATKMLTDSLLLELTSLLIKQEKSREDVLEALNLSLDDFVERCVSVEWCHIVPVLFTKLVIFSINCADLWDMIVLKSPAYNRILSYVNDNVSIKEEIISITPKKKKRDANDVEFVKSFRRYIVNKFNLSKSQLNKIEIGIGRLLQLQLHLKLK